MPCSCHGFERGCITITGQGNFYVNKYLHQTLYFFLLLILIFASRQSIANPDDAFDYSQTVALILKTENGGYIFQRPEQDDPITDFVPAFAITYKYTAQMQPNQSGLALDMESLQPQHTFLLINNQSTKLLYLGDHWLGDENAFSVMEAADYQSLKNIFESRMRVSKPTPDEAQQAYIKSIHELWQEDSEEFYRRYYFPERNAQITASSASAVSSSFPARDFSQQNNPPRERSSATIKDGEDATRLTGPAKNSEAPYKDIQENADSNTKGTNNLQQILLLIFILVLTALYWWWRQSR